MENDILEALSDVDYMGPMLEPECLTKALSGGAKSLEYTVLIEWIGKELKKFCQLDEHINAITTPDDSSSFLMEVSSFLKELGCAYKCLTEGHLSERLSTQYNCTLLVDFLLSELQAARMIQANQPDINRKLQVHVTESSTASDLKALLLALQFPKPPAQITPAMLFSKVEKKLQEALAKAPKELIGTPLFNSPLTPKQWEVLETIQTELQAEYKIRREMLIKRLDVTIHSFQWSERVQNKEDQIAGMFRPRRQAMALEPSVRLADLLAARDDLAILEKTSSATVRQNTQTSVNKVVIGSVPDRGGRPSEQQRPPPEMPSWEKERKQGGGGFQGNRGGDRDRGRGGRVQGQWRQGVSGQQDHVQGGWNQNRGGHRGHGNTEGADGNRGGRGKRREHRGGY